MLNPVVVANDLDVDATLNKFKKTNKCAISKLEAVGDVRGRSTTYASFLQPRNPYPRSFIRICLIMNTGSKELFHII